MRDSKGGLGRGGFLGAPRVETVLAGDVEGGSRPVY